MNTSPRNHPKKSVSRIFAVSVALGIALATGAATAASAAAATPASHEGMKDRTTQSSPAGEHDRGSGKYEESGSGKHDSGWEATWSKDSSHSSGKSGGNHGGGGDDCTGVIVLLCA
ncbi:hypothetical protein AB0D04_01680 [Streptomyces sp. NPDC048483]|uniref:hypothetical protein n=1 Tax=Streptomyces sp. NPDC048483 TaxID=3154927 RepID=UPI003437F37B